MEFCTPGAIAKKIPKIAVLEKFRLKNKIQI
jgi:hypothetical protein